AKKSAARTPAKAAKAARPAKRAAARKAAPRRAAAAPKKPTGPMICHWEIQSQRPETLQAFYSDVFGWKIDASNPMNYGMVSSGRGSGGIDGGIGGTQGPGSRVLVYANVPEINAILAKIEERGGRTLMPRTDVGPVIMALYADPEGNVMGVIEG
ncbi:MAG TPA: VOC family protein, partial [Polyangiaceae bacterium]